MIAASGNAFGRRREMLKLETPWDDDDVPIDDPVPDEDDPGEDDDEGDEEPLRTNG
jgi:hypothetical protein